MAYDINGEQLPYRKIITIDGSMVTTETGIPLARNIVLPGVKSDGSDIRLSQLDGTPIAREIECVGVPSTDAVMIHYPFNTIAGNNSQFYVYWGNPDLAEPAADSTYGSQAVWDNVAVWNLNNDPNGDVANSILDSTLNDHSGTPVGSMTTSDLIDGKSIDFDGTDDRIVINSADFLDSKQSGSVHFRFYPHVSEASGLGVYSTVGSLNSVYDLEINADDTVQIAYKYSGGAGLQYVITSVETININEWNDVTFVSTGTTHKIIVNGVDSSLTGDVGVAAGGWFADMNELANAHYFHIGHFFRSGTVTASEFDGLIDMVDISDNYDVDYVSTTHNNLNNPTASGTDPFYLADGIVEHQRRHPIYQN